MDEIYVEALQESLSSMFSDKRIYEEFTPLEDDTKITVSIQPTGDFIDDLENVAHQMRRSYLLKDMNISTINVEADLGGKILNSTFYLTRALPSCYLDKKEEQQ